MSRSVNSDYGLLPKQGILRTRPAEQKQGNMRVPNDPALLNPSVNKSQSAELQAQVGPLCTLIADCKGNSQRRYQF